MPTAVADMDITDQNSETWKPCSLQKTIAAHHAIQQTQRSKDSSLALKEALTQKVPKSDC